MVIYQLIRESIWIATLKFFLISCDAASVIGALTGLGLSFTALSPLVIGGIVSFIPLALFTADCIGDLLKDPIEKDDKETTLFFIIMTLASAAIRVGLAAGVTAIFPGAMLGMGSAALAGATIGVIAPIAVFFAPMAITFAAEKVNEYIISPIIECFSSKKQDV